MKKFGRFFWQSPKNNDIRLRRAKALRSEDVVFPSFFFVFPSLHERVARGDNRLCLLSLRQNNNPSFPGHAPGKDTLRAANAAMKERFTGRKRVKRKRLPVVFPSFFFVFPSFPERVARRENGLCLLSLRQNKNSSFPGHAPGKDTLRAANAATKEGFTGRKQNKRSEFCCLPVIFCRYSSAISPVPTAYRSHRVFFLMKNPLCSCMYTPPQSKAVHP